MLQHYSIYIFVFRKQFYLLRDILLFFLSKMLLTEVLINFKSDCR